MEGKGPPCQHAHCLLESLCFGIVPFYFYYFYFLETTTSWSKFTLQYVMLLRLLKCLLVIVFGLPTITTLNTIYGVTYYLKLHNAIYFDYICKSLPSKNVNVLKCPNHQFDLVGKKDITK